MFRFVFAAASAVASASVLPAACWAQQAAPPAPIPASAPANGNEATLDLTLQTGPAPGSSSAKNAKPLPPMGAGGLSSRAMAALASRHADFDRASMQKQSAPAVSTAPSVTATLGLVLPASASLRISQAANSRLLNTVHQGTYLAVVADGGTHWGVLMVNNTMGWISKSALQMIDYQTQVSLPAQVSSSRQFSSGSAAGMVGSLAEGLDARSGAILREAFTYLGVPYVWAGNTRAGLDCSAFVKSVYAAQGIRLPRTAAEQAYVGQNVGNGDDLLPGDRLYFDMGRKGRVSHCGIYVGNGLFIHASTNHGRVDVDPLSKPNYSRALVAVRR